MAHFARRILFTIKRPNQIYINIGGKRNIAVSLSQKHLTFQRTCRDFAEDEIIPVAANIDKEGTFPKEIVGRLGKLGMLAIDIPAKYGGMGLDSLSYTIAIEEISRASASCGVIAAVNNSLYLEPLSKFGTENQKQNYIEPYVDGANIGCFGLSDKDNINIRSTLAKLDGDQWILNGTKAWTTNGKEASATIVFATTDTNDAYNNLNAFIVPMPTEGLARGRKETKLGFRGSSRCQIMFDDCRIPRENILGSPGSGLKIAFNTLDSGRIGYAAKAIGIAQASIDTAKDYAMERKASNCSVSTFENIQNTIAQMEVKTECARLMSRQAAYLKDNDQIYSKQAAMAKMSATEAARFSTAMCVQLLGGINDESNLDAERFYRDARVTDLFEPTSTSERALISQI